MSSTDTRAGAVSVVCTVSGRSAVSAVGGSGLLPDGSIALGVGSRILAVIAVRVDARVKLVQQVGLVWAIGLGGRSIEALVITSGAKGVALSVGTSRSSMSSSVSSCVGAGMCSCGRTGVCGCRVGRLVGAQGLLDFVNEARHDGNFCMEWAVKCKILLYDGYIIGVILMGSLSEI